MPAPAPKGMFGGARDVRAYTSEDIRFTTVGESLYAFGLAWPEGGKVTIKTLAEGSASYPKEIARVEMLGRPGPLAFTRNPSGVAVTLPEKRPGDFAYTLKINS